jgi:hypothetical protein
VQRERRAGPASLSTSAAATSSITPVRARMRSPWKAGEHQLALGEVLAAVEQQHGARADHRLEHARARRRGAARRRAR